mgnify:CR=1 FL=1
MNQAQAIEQMNQYGAAKIPFLFIIDFEGTTAYIKKLSEVNPQEVLYDIRGTRNTSGNHGRLAKQVIFQKKPQPFAQYRQGFEQVLEHINFGNSYLLNFSALTPIDTNLTLHEVFTHSKATYKLWFRDEWVVFSPEIFVQIEEGKIASYPMKGTIDAAIPDAENMILADPKETAEHNTIVDLIRNDLSTVAKNVRVERFRYIDALHTLDKTLLQVSSKIVGELPLDYASKIGELMFTLLPAGSISGAPKKKTVEVIKAAEDYQRGFYTGVMGIFDGQNLDSGVMIRFIERINHQLYFKSGGGITTFSQAEAEYQELIDKVYVPIIRDHSV